MNVIARRKPGVSEEQAQTEVSAIAARLEQQYPDTNTRKGIRSSNPRCEPWSATFVRRC